jgi:hypothetical protein
MKSPERTACLSPSGAKSLSKNWENQSRKQEQDTNFKSTSGDLPKLRQVAVIQTLRAKFQAHKTIRGRIHRASLK